MTLPLTATPERPRDRHWHAAMSAIVDLVFMFDLNLISWGDALPSESWAEQMES
jgi:hypothetical protein